VNNPVGITIVNSRYTVKETIDRLQTTLEQRHVTIYARINQQEELQKTGQKILPLEFLLFGNPKGGGPVMIANPAAALDLPLKVIAWQDYEQTYVAYNEAGYIKDRYSLSPEVVTPLNIDSLIAEIIS